MRRATTFLLLVVAGLCLGAAPARASVSQVVDGLRQDRLFIAAESVISPDADAVRAALEDAPVPTYVAVVPQAEVEGEELGIDGFLMRVVEQLGDPEAVVLVVTDGQELQARDGGTSGTDPAAALDSVLAERIDEPFTPDNLTGAIVDFTARLGDAAPGGSPDQGSTRRTVGLVGLVVVAALACGWLYARAQRRALASAPLTSEDEQASGWQATARKDQEIMEP